MEMAANQMKQFGISQIMHQIKIRYKNRPSPTLKDYPSDYDDANEYRNGSDEAYESWKSLASNLSSDYPGADVFTFHHGAIAYDLREMFESDELEDDIEQLTGSKATSIFTDYKGHAGDLLIDTGHWLGFMQFMELIPQRCQSSLSGMDIRQIAKQVIEE